MEFPSRDVARALAALMSIMVASCTADTPTETSATGTFDATLATAQTTLGAVVAASGRLTFHVNDGTTRVYARVE